MAASFPGPLRNKFLATKLFFSFPGARDIAAISSLLDKVLGKASKLSWEMPRDLPRCEVTSAMSFLVNIFRRDLNNEDTQKLETVFQHPRKTVHYFCLSGICKTTAAL